MRPNTVPPVDIVKRVGLVAFVGQSGQHCGMSALTVQTSPVRSAPSPVLSVAQS